MAFWNRKKKAQPEPIKAGKQAGPTGTTFKQRVEDFWRWWEHQSEFMLAEIDEGRCPDLQPELSNRTHELWNFAWVFGPPPDGVEGHSFTLSGEGDIHRQFLTEYWLRKAPELSGWTFYPSRQPGTLSPEAGFCFGETTFTFGGFWVSPRLREEDQVVDIKAWHPGFAEVDEDLRGTALFVMLDEVLGEYGTGQWLGAIEVNDDALTDAMPAMELRQFLHDLEIERGWKKGPPTEMWANFSRDPQESGELRNDIYTGTVRNFPLIRDVPYSEDPLEGSGAEYVFLALPIQEVSGNENLVFRHELEDRLEASLEPDLGLHLGGCMGVHHSYIDLLLFDGQRSIDQIMDILAQANPPSGSGLHFFAPRQQARRRILN